MRKKHLLIVLISLFFMLIACAPNETTELPDFNTYTEVSFEQTEISTIYIIPDLELTKDNSIYVVFYNDIYKGTFIGVDEGDTVFSIEFEFGFYDWYDAIEEGELHAYYK